jgi:hypothetical protein
MSAEDVNALSAQQLQTQLAEESNTNILALTNNAGAIAAGNSSNPFQNDVDYANWLNAHGGNGAAYLANRGLTSSGSPMAGTMQANGNQAIQDTQASSGWLPSWLIPPAPASSTTPNPQQTASQVPAAAAGGGSGVASGSSSGTAGRTTSTGSTAGSATSGGSSSSSSSSTGSSFDFTSLLSGNNLLYIGGAAVVLFLFMGKKH